MIAIVLIGLAAGCASALMFASIISGALISLLLFYLATLPLMVAALGWGPLAATIGGIVAASGLGAIFGLPYCIAFAITVAVPAWWLGHLALLGRPLPSAGSGNGAAPAAPSLEWYPVGRILLWIAGFAALATIAAMLTLGTDAETITNSLRRGLSRILGARDAATSGDIERWVAALAVIAPAAATIVAMITLTLNLWLAAKITATSGRLHRPWPDLKSAELPPMVVTAFPTALPADRERFQEHLGDLCDDQGESACAEVGIVSLKAASATDYAAGYAQERRQFGKPIASFQGIQFKLADMETRTAAARELLYRACAKIDRHEPDRGKYSAMAKLFASDTAMAVTVEAVQVLGGYGYVTEYPVERYMRDAKITQIYEGTNEIQRLVIARTL